MRIRILLLQGCCDGASWEVDVANQPKLLYKMWPGYVDSVKAVTDPAAREALRSDLSILAYRFAGSKVSSDSKTLELRYVRFPRKDLPLPDHAPTPSL